MDLRNYFTLLVAMIIENIKLTLVEFYSQINDESYLECVFAQLEWYK